VSTPADLPCRIQASFIRLGTQSTLEFDLRLQEYIELTRVRKYEEAIPYSKKYLTPWYETHGVQITQAFNLLAFPPTTTCTPYKVWAAYILTALF
jgi:CTLH/CRA C-terminal to LisH motif domain